MENVAHSMVGLLVAKTGLERLSPGATTACVIAANIPDADVLTGFGGRWFVLEQHRGVSHSILAVFVFPLLIAGVYKLFDLIWTRVRGNGFGVRYWPLCIAAFVACATHPVLDWTNNYGVRPLLPWSGRWFYGDLVFIVDPWIWLIAGGCAFIATSTSRWRSLAWTLAWVLMGSALVFYLTRSMHPARTIIIAIWVCILAILVSFRYLLRFDRQKSAVAIAGLAVVLLYWGALAVMHRRALIQAVPAAATLAGGNEKVIRLSATPTFADPRFWQINFETDKASYRFNLGLNRPPDPDRVLRYPKLTGAPAALLSEAEKDTRARIFLGFARFPVEVVQGSCNSKILVEFADLRYTQPQASTQGNFGLAVEVPCTTSIDRISR